MACLHMICIIRDWSLITGSGGGGGDTKREGGGGACEVLPLRREGAEKQIRGRFYVVA